ncbi:MAG: hypothetical protein C4526_03565 [Nitrospiraceae bacterium]|nr:MAG: hypothetical protein C4526_03565 [Nitrospiraceae bacterium]
MLEGKRRFKRFDLPLIVKFRPTGGKTQYSLGLMKNISAEGLSLEAREFNFIRNESLELQLKFPQGDAPLSMFGDVMWKRREGNINYAGVKFQAQKEGLYNEIIERISHHTNIPRDSFLKGKDVYHKGRGKEVLSRPTVQKKEMPQKPEKQGLVKQYLEDGSTCRVTFRLSKAAAPEARSVTVVGDFNDWDMSGIQMIKLKSGDFSVSVDLSSGREYKFKYLIDGDRWENDWHADKYAPNSFGADDSVVIT